MHFGILGSGFGIYGWMAALNHFKNIKISTLFEYKKKIYTRDDLVSLSNFVQSITWHENVQSILNEVDTIIIARRPSDQFDLVNYLIDNSWKGSLILEKPIATNPSQALELLNKLINKKTNIAVGFTISETNWAKKTCDIILREKPKQVNIEWNLHAYHYRKNAISWKQDPSLGGGALNFYCIHLIAWLESFSDWNVNYCSSLESKNNDPKIKINLSNKITDLTINFDSKNEDHSFFKVLINNDTENPLHEMENPFLETSNSKLIYSDQRIPYLISILKNVLDNKWSDKDKIMKHVNLWKNICEARSN